MRTRTRPAGRRRARRGATLVESALLLSIFLMFLFGVFEYCRYLLVLHVATNAARDGARHATVHVNDATYTGTQGTDDTYGGGRQVFDVPKVTAYVKDRLGTPAGRPDGVVDRTIEPRGAVTRVQVFPCDAATLYGTELKIQPKAQTAPPDPAWNNAGFSQRIAVRITGVYRPVVPNILFLNNEIRIDVVSVMGSEG